MELQKEMYDIALDMLSEDIEQYKNVEDALIDYVLAEGPDEMPLDSATAFVEGFLDRNYDDIYQEARMLCEESREWALAREEGVRGNY